MPNPNPKLENLTSYKPKWKSGKTRTIRVPVAIAERVLEVAHQIDEGKLIDTSEYVSKENTNIASNDEIKRLKLIIEELQQQLIYVTSDKNLVSSPSQSEPNLIQLNITDTSKSFDETKVRATISKGLSIPSNLGGEIKIPLAQLGNLLGFKIKKVGKRWVMSDTSKTDGIEEIGKIISEGLSTPSRFGGRIKTNLAQIGNLLGFKLEKKGRGGGKWVFTDTSD